ncbi:MAG: glycosyltransferase family 2 protein [Coriobacteriales bacterium]|jgi:hypothetical protein
MNLNPVVVIPTYWCGRRSTYSVERGVRYDHMTPLDQEGELPRCLDSLRQVVGLGRIVLLVVSEPGLEAQAEEHVREIAERFRDLNIVVVGDNELRHIHRRFDQEGLSDFKDTVCLTGYGSIRNLGLVVASIFGHDVVVFIDDDEVILGPDFLERAVYGVAYKTPGGSVITAKTGYFLDSEGSPTSPDKVPWYDHFWNKAKGFNEYISKVLEGPRLSRSNVACGGCLVLHAAAYGSVAFDPWIPRGEDLDYVLSAHMYGTDVWFDNKLNLQHIPPADAQRPTRFEADLGRWFYEVRKIEFAKTQIDLMQVVPASFNPYPGPWLTPHIARRARMTSFLRAIGHREHKDYLHIGGASCKEAAEYARENCAKYFEFQHQWPTIVRSLWNNTPLAAQLSGSRVTQSVNPGFTGRFSAIKVDTPSGSNGAGA